jgi:type II secretory ATPase GspE/PulE/Tfp pilus assembly ATPase PilB-like protein
MNKKREKITDEIVIKNSLAIKIKRRITNLSSFKEELKRNLGENTSDFLNIIMAGGVVIGTSDIHIEPLDEGAKIRIRIDGVLQDVIELERKTYKDILSRIKLISGVKLNVEKKPQDGRFTILYPGEEKERAIEIRMSSLPSEYGETIVMRILDPRKLITIEKLGLRSELEKIFKKEINKPNGMIIVTGPTGSGKTTTLYAFLKHIRNPGIKIVTIEDPIEYHLKNISQTEVDPSKGYDFANGLRAIVRQDPDVILVGEIRDLETASIGLQAALTGHTVFSTLHTNDAAGAIPRLQALGEKPVNIAPAVNVIIAQRLVRKLCERCKEEVSLEEMDDEEFLTLKKSLGKMDDFTVSRENTIYKAKGCKKCNFSGYKGRLGVFEALVIDEEIQELIFTNPSTSEIRKKAIEKGMTTLQQNGVIKILEGKTTLEEINRVVGL